MIKQRMVELNYSRIYKSYTIELKHKETNAWYLVQEVNIQTDWFFITKIHKAYTKSINLSAIQIMPHMK